MDGNTKGVGNCPIYPIKIISQSACYAIVNNYRKKQKKGNFKQNGQGLNPLYQPPTISSKPLFIAF